MENETVNKEAYDSPAQEKTTNCGVCEYAEFAHKPKDNVDPNTSTSAEDFTCKKGVKDVVVSCPHFKQKLKEQPFQA